MTDSLTPLPSSQLRAMLQEMVRKDLPGPAGGPDEIVDESNMRGRYVVDMLVPNCHRCESHAYYVNRTPIIRFCVILISRLLALRDDFGPIVATQYLPLPHRYSIIGGESLIPSPNLYNSINLQGASMSI